MNLFRSKSVSLEEQLDNLRGCGLVINDGATLEGFIGHRTAFRHVDIAVRGTRLEFGTLVTTNRK